jgi:hypothetical protein
MTNFETNVQRQGFGGERVSYTPGKTVRRANETCRAALRPWAVVSYVTLNSKETSILQRRMRLMMGGTVPTTT